MELDAIDRRIIQCLLDDGRPSNNDIAARVGLTPGPLSRRLSRLYAEGAIRAGVTIDHHKLGFGFQAFLQITLERSGAKVAEAFVARIGRMPEVTECHMIAGDFDFLLKIAVRDAAEYKRLLWSEFETIADIKSMRSLILLDTSKAGPSGLPPHRSSEPPLRPRRHAARP